MTKVKRHPKILADMKKIDSGRDSFIPPSSKAKPKHGRTTPTHQPDHHQSVLNDESWWEEETYFCAAPDTAACINDDYHNLFRADLHRRLSSWTRILQEWQKKDEYSFEKKKLKRTQRFCVFLKRNWTKTLTSIHSFMPSLLLHRMRRKDGVLRVNHQSLTRLVHVGRHPGGFLMD